MELTARDLENLQIHGLATAGPNLKQEEIKSIEVVSAKLHAVLTGPPLQYQDAVAQYKLQIENRGSTACEKITAKIQLPAGVVYQSGIERATQQGNTLVWPIDSILGWRFGNVYVSIAC